MRKKKSTRRNTGGRRTVTPPPFSIEADVRHLEDQVQIVDLAMKVGAAYGSRWR